MVCAVYDMTVSVSGFYNDGINIRHAEFISASNQAQNKSLKYNAMHHVISTRHEHCVEFRVMLLASNERLPMAMLTGVKFSDILIFRI